MAKTPKTKFPKTVAGFKVPKSLRKGGFLDAMVGTATGRQLLADALIAAAGAAAATLVSGRAGPARDRGGKAQEGAAGALATFVTEAAKAILPAPEPAEKPAVRRTPKNGAGAKAAATSGTGRAKRAARRTGSSGEAANASSQKSEAGADA